MGRAFCAIHQLIIPQGKFKFLYRLFCDMRGNDNKVTNLKINIMKTILIETQMTNQHVKTFSVFYESHV